MSAQFKPTLSIVIPTYNRAPRLSLSLQALATELACIDKDCIEVVVCSNGSTDNTDAVVEQFREKIPNLRYFVNEKNFGIDENIRRVAKHSVGRFIRFLSDDDLVIPGSTSQLLNFLKIKSDLGLLFLTPGTLCIENGIEGVRSSVFASNSTASDPQIFSPEDFLDNIGIWLTFISSFVVRRDLWINDVDDSLYVGTDIFLAYKIIDAVAFGGRGSIDTEITVGVRPDFTGNYRIFRAFGPEWRKLLLEHAVKRGLNPSIMRYLWERTTISDLLPRIGRARLNSTWGPEEKSLIESLLSDAPGILYRARLMMILPTSILEIIKKFRKIKIRSQNKDVKFIPAEQIVPLHKG